MTLCSVESITFLVLIDGEITKLISGSREIVYPDAGHQMWYKHPDKCREATEQFSRNNPR